MSELAYDEGDYRSNLSEPHRVSALVSPKSCDTASYTKGRNGDRVGRVGSSPTGGSGRGRGHSRPFLFGFKSDATKVGSDIKPPTFVILDNGLGFRSLTPIPQEKDSAGAATKSSGLMA